MRNCTAVEFVARLPPPLFMHPSPREWPGAKYFEPAVIGYAMDCGQVVFEPDTVIHDVAMCWVTHSNVTEKPGAWDEGQYSGLMVHMLFVVNKSVDVFEQVVPSLKPVSGEVHVQAEQNGELLEMDASCAWKEAHMHAQATTPVGGHASQAGMRRTYRTIVDADAPSWWSTEFVARHYELVPNFRVATSGSLEVEGGPFAEWPTRYEDTIFGVSMLASANDDYRWRWNGTGLD